MTEVQTFTLKTGRASEFSPGVLPVVGSVRSIFRTSYEFQIYPLKASLFPETTVKQLLGQYSR